MKAISLYEPWATLMSIDEKRYETRSWDTKYRGPLLICASKKRLSLYKYPPLAKVSEALHRHGLGLIELNWGRAVAIVDLVTTFPTDYLIPGQPLLDAGPDEQYFGDFRPGRFGWKTSNLRRIRNPFPVLGKRGLFEVYIDWQEGR